MGDELFLNPRELGAKAPDYGDGLKTAAAKVKPERAEAKPKTEAALDAAADKNAWQQSSEVKAIIESLQGQNSEISIVMDSEAHQIIVKILDSATGEVIRRMPLKDPVPVSQGRKEFTGLLLDATE